MKLNNKAFTIIELIVVIGIMALMMIMVFPSINNLRESNTTTEFKEYEKSLIAGAKLYVNQNEEDLFVNTTDNTINITREDLIKNNYAKDYTSRKGIYTCGNLSSTEVCYIEVKRDITNRSYTYTVKNLVCKKGTKTIYNSG